MVSDDVTMNNTTLDITQNNTLNSTTSCGASNTTSLGAALNVEGDNGHIDLNATGFILPEPEVGPSYIV